MPKSVETLQTADEVDMSFVLKRITSEGPHIFGKKADFQAVQIEYGVHMGQ